MNRSISNQDYADLFNDGLPWRENNYKIDFSQFLSIMKWLEFQITGTHTTDSPYDMDHIVKSRSLSEPFLDNRFNFKKRNEGHFRTF